jgi:outer membrane protein assembly factor BamB
MRLARFTLACSLLFATTAPAQQAAQGMFRGNPEHTGVYESASAPTLSGVQWKFKTTGKVISTPVVDRDAVYFGSTDHKLYAVNRADGSLKWAFDTYGPVNSSPAVSNGLVMFGSVDGRFYAVDASTGRQKWMFRTAGESRFTAPGIHGAIPRTELMADPFDVFLSSPTVANGTVYFGSGDHNVYALDVATGTLKWNFRTGNVVHASPAVANNVVYIGSWDRNMYALDARSGNKLWEYQTGNDTTIYNQVGIASSAAVFNGVVFFGCRDGHFYAVDAKTGAPKWSVDNNKGWVISSPAIKDGVVYFPTSDGQRFKAVDASTGAIKYNVGMRTISFSSPAIVGNTIYFGTSDGWVHALDLRSGATKADFQTDGSKANASRYIDEKGGLNSAALYPDFTLEGMYIGMDRMQSLGSILSSAVIADGVLYVGSTDGNLYALK